MNLKRIVCILIGCETEAEICLVVTVTGKTYAGDLLA